MALASTLDRSHARVLVHNRWLILFFSVLSMVAVANYQYGWTLFVPPLQKKLGVDQATIQVTFTVFVLLETWLVPFEGWLVDRFGPRLLVMAAGAIAGVGWILSGKAETVTGLYLSYALCGIGAGIVYGTAMGIALKWFPDHRGLAAGLTAAGFGAGSAFTVAPIANMINSAGYQQAFITWGIVQGIVVLVAALFIEAPAPDWAPGSHAGRTAQAHMQVKGRQSGVDFTASQMAETPQFWLMYAMMTLVATGGLMAVAQLNPMAQDFKVATIPVSFLWLTMPALQFALSADRLVNGICRPFWGWLSDHIGREKTMATAFGLEAIAIIALINFAHRPLLFVVFSAFTFFGWGEIFSLFPATCGDFFGRKYATTNYGFLYTAKGTASVLVPIGSALAAGRAFELRADVLLLVGGLLAMFTHFLAPTVFRLHISKRTRNILFSIGLALVVYGVVLAVLPKLWAPFSLKLTMPKIGWTGVFGMAVVFDLIAAALSIFVLRRMKVPALKASAGAPGAAGSAPLIAAPAVAARRDP
jgi:OFA family oxalate/formate antiporter-like MFS transporter